MFRTAITLLWALAPLHALAQSLGDGADARDNQGQAPDQSYYSGEARLTKEIVPEPGYIEKDPTNDWGPPPTTGGAPRPAGQLRSVVTDRASGLLEKLGGPVADSANGREDTQIRTAQMTGDESGDRVRGGPWNSMPDQERDDALPPDAAIDAEENHPRDNTETFPAGRRYIAAPPTIGSGFGADAPNHRVASQDRSSPGPPRTALADQTEEPIQLEGENSADASDAATDQNPLTQNRWALWLTMGLLASLAGNLFFGWVAWDTHARYQDLVDDMQESDKRLETPRRQPRDEHRRSTTGSRDIPYAERDVEFLKTT